MKKLQLVLVVLLALLLAFGGVASAKSLYVIADINSVPTPIRSYDIQAAPSYLVFQVQNGVPNHGWGAVGLTIDTDSKFLFVTYENSNTIQLVDATTMSDEGTVTAPGAGNLAGIVVDQGKKKVYTVDRSTNHLYVYSWDSTTKTLTLDGGTYKSLSGVSAAHGIALDEKNGKLYVGDLTTNVKIFNTNDWSAAGTKTVSQKVMGIAIDVSNQILYTGNAYPAYGSLGRLCKYDMGTSTETYITLVNDNVVGLAVDPPTGLLYITTGNQGSGGSDKLMVYDKNLNQLWQSSDIGNPTGLCIPGKEISYNPLNLAKSDSKDPVKPGEQFSYTITYDNANAYPVDNVVIKDTLPAEVDFVSATGGGTEAGGVVTWNLGTVAAGASGSLTVTVEVKAGTPDGMITNSVVIESDQTPQTTVNEQTKVETGTIPTPEFPTVALPVAMIVGMVFIIHSIRKKE
ncbi:MAG: hypothetical protein APR53_07985 [Methanoculleus sp. SDB]|nr:MAG: hypothetical protein APR53_07985 [Methanoculleus sp. SDB]